MQVLNLSKKTWPAWAVLGIALLATVFVSLQVKKSIEQDAIRQFAFTSDQVTLKIKERLDAYSLILRGGAALFGASISVGRHEWRSYVETLNVEKTVPGVQGIGFAQAIAADQLASHIAAIRAEGFPAYAVRPAGERDFYSAIIYLEPFRDRNLNAFGYDMWSEPVRRAAMLQARDSGEIALSGKVELVQESGRQNQAGFLMYFPVYRNGWPTGTMEQKRAALFGWAYSPYRMNDLMGGILHDWENREGKAVHLEIYDGLQVTPATLLLDTKANHTAEVNSQFYQQRTIDFNGHAWLLVFDPTATNSVINYAQAWTTLMGGLALCGLLFGLMQSMTNTRANAERIANELTQALRDREALLKASEFRWKFAIEGAGDGLWDSDLTDNTVFYSKRWKEMLGCTEDEIGNSIDEWTNRIHPEDKTTTLAGLQDYLDGKTPFYADEHRLRCKDGSYKWIHARGMVVSRSENGQPVRLIGTNTDISARKQAQAALQDSLRFAQQIIEAIPSPCFYKDSDGRYLGCNSAFEHFLGRRQDEIIGRSVYDLSPKELADI